MNYVSWQQELDQKVTEYEDEQKMPYITSMERRGIKKGLEQALQMRIQQALEQRREHIILVLEARFGEVSPALAQRLNLISEDALLKMLLQHSATVDSVATFEQKLAQVESRPN